MSKYPLAIDVQKIGEYPALCKSGGGYFFDEVLEYRVWCHPGKGAKDQFDGDDYFFAFPSYEDAWTFSQKTKGAEEPLVLVRQLEWINEPESGTFEHCKGERITEWLPRWLDRGARKVGDIEKFIIEKMNN